MIIALGRGADVRLRVVLFVAAAYLTVFVTGLAMLFVFTGTGAAEPQVRTPSAGVYVAAGAALLLIAERLRRPRRKPPKRSDGPSKTDRYLGSRRLVVLLGLILYVVPVAGRDLDDDLAARLRAALRVQLSPRHVPDEIHQVPGIPRTLSGKKLEVPVRKILLGAEPEQAADPNALANPEILVYFGGSRPAAAGGQAGPAAAGGQAGPAAAGGQASRVAPPAQAPDPPQLL